ncbi:MAG: hypothetical protein JWM11_7839 [Planctomycetaceae bacterium]|nr:hypothetical protein [Planctomycetaceae bacterium]
MTVRESTVAESPIQTINSMWQLIRMFAENRHAVEVTSRRQALNFSL